MEYYITLTYNCNLKCSYCAAQKVVFCETQNRTMSRETIDKIVDYIMNDYVARKEQSYIVFYGGEPTLVMDLIEYILIRTRHTTLKYILYTNGLLLKDLTQHILDNIDIAFISIDGDKDVHDFYKFDGSYNQVLENTRWLGENSNIITIARITLQEESDLFSSVINVYKDFHYIFWQIVNKPNFDSPDTMLSKYTESIRTLFSFWQDEIKKNNFIQIIPFIALLTDIPSNTRNTFKCGMGVSQIDFDISGNVFMCDEYIGQTDHICGNINNSQSINITKKYNFEVHPWCKDCSISNICRGRCRHALEAFSDETNKLYCNLTKALTSTVVPMNIEHWISNKDKQIIEITEQIP